ncbi:hypothetical protein ACFL34_05205 [Candidatus Sumerlaeota bacterium]
MDWLARAETRLHRVAPWQAQGKSNKDIRQDAVQAIDDCLAGASIISDIKWHREKDFD